MFLSALLERIEFKFMIIVLTNCGTGSYEAMLLYLLAVP
jgi:hypothetical protein